MVIRLVLYAQKPKRLRYVGDSINMYKNQPSSKLIFLFIQSLYYPNLVFKVKTHGSEDFHAKWAVNITS